MGNGRRALVALVMDVRVTDTQSGLASVGSLALTNGVAPRV